MTASITRGQLNAYRANEYVRAIQAGHPDLPAIVTAPAGNYCTEQIASVAWIYKPDAYGLPGKGTALITTTWETWGIAGERRFNGTHTKVRFSAAQERGLRRLLAGLDCPLLTLNALIRMGLVRRSDRSSLTEWGFLLAEALEAGRAEG